MRVFRHVAGLFIVAVSLSNIWAQTVPAQLTGVVTDVSGAVIPGAEVVATNTQTNVKVHRLTNSLGYYTITDLEPGRYQLQVQKNGFRSATTSSTYDQLDRILSKTYSDNATPQVGYLYDQGPPSCYFLGRLVSVTSASPPPSGTQVGQSQTICYDPLGHPLGTTEVIQSNPPFSFSNYTYDLAGHLTSITYPSRRVVNTTYDFAGRPITLGGTQLGVSTTYTNVSQYAPQGVIAAMTLGNNLIQQSCFNNRLQPVGIRVGSGTTSSCANNGTSDPLNISYGYNPGGAANNGDLESQTIQRNVNGSYQSWAQTYSVYDAEDRLISASEGSNWTQTYSYDQWGNRALSSGSYNPRSDWSWTPSSTSQFTNNRWNRETGGDKQDANGNTLWIAAQSLPTSQPGSTWSSMFTYDAENRMTSANIANTGSVSYGYDGDGRRIWKTVGTAATLYVYDGFGHLAMEFGPNTTDGTWYLSADALGSTRLITTSTGSTEKCYDDLPFGEDIPQSVGGRPGCFTTPTYPSGSPDIESLKFTGKERDAETGLDYFGARYFSGAMGRFTSADQPFNDQDPSSPQSWNLYAYGRNNPLIFTDPNGTNCVYNGSGGMNDSKNFTDDNNGGQTCAQAFQNVGATSGSFKDPDASPVVNAADPNNPDVQGNTVNYTYTRQENVAYQFGIVAETAGPAVNALGETMKFGGSLAFPLAGLAVDLAAGRDPKQSAAQAAMSRKPGSLGKFKSADALRRENKIARDIIKQLNLTGKRAEQVHQLIQGYSIDEGYVAEFPELLKYVKDVLGLL